MKSGCSWRTRPEQVRLATSANVTAIKQLKVSAVATTPTAGCPLRLNAQRLNSAIAITCNTHTLTETLHLTW